jgi:hypothetical protein
MSIFIRPRIKGKSRAADPDRRSLQNSKRTSSPQKRTSSTSKNEI